MNFSYFKRNSFVALALKIGVFCVSLYFLYLFSKVFAVVLGMLFVVLKTILLAGVVLLLVAVLFNLIFGRDLFHLQNFRRYHRR